MVSSLGWDLQLTTVNSTIAVVGLHLTMNSTISVVGLHLTINSTIAVVGLHLTINSTISTLWWTPLNNKQHNQYTVVDST